MNERIKQLAKQAEEFSHWTNDGHTANYRINPEKFAELIVQECADLFDKNETDIRIPEYQIHDSIMIHFGLY
jgi:thymidylate synthase